MLDKKLYYRKSNSGFTLIEVLIAMFVLSVGMLGSTALMLQGRSEAVKTNYEAKAMQLALGIAEQMRANIAGVTTGAYDAVATPGADPNCIATSCTVANMAAYDEFLWGQTLASNLPSGTGTVVTDGAPTDAIFTITVSWAQTRKTSATTGVAQTKSYTMIFQP